LWWQGSDGEAGAKCDFAHFRPSKAGCMITAGFLVHPCFHSAAALILGGGFFSGVEDNARAENVTEKPRMFKNAFKRRR
jgi:hypothetical protein